ncbi:DNA-binding transcriptional regulator, AcrR family [Tenacibaculum sp. MAR_2009_124]|uniref:TetR/AcrR family transcriptional regulator n=1 Tax=Tenacibaculum sp. MAR_2009_124 TaxID=1250059 RepID=UPI00089D949C|nr:TetR/AcrR family transcriptional regulator [Tenacibaculum sp. MAR_2009_124]SEB45654.1 DNA-binding transcriptional regulator, AcrR family [Tenacibaculum sp. MAR_2009_124]
MKLKTKILLKAIELFNSEGIANVSPNKIAKALNISAGNLTYHYKTKLDLLTAIFERMVAESKDYLGFGTQPASLMELKQILSNFRKLQIDYNFIFIDNVFITRKYPTIGELFKQLSLIRFENGRKLIDALIESKRVIPENNYTNYNNLVHVIWFINIYWSSQDELLQNHLNNKTTTISTEIIWNLIYPYLTPLGKNEYEEINAYNNGVLNN